MKAVEDKHVYTVITLTMLVHMKFPHSIATKKVSKECSVFMVQVPPLLKRLPSSQGFGFTYCIVLVRLAAPQVADHSLQSLHAHCTVWQVHIVLLFSFSGGWVQVCGRPEQSGCCTTIWSVWMDRVLSANPQVADQSVHGFQVHSTLLQGPWRLMNNNCCLRWLSVVLRSYVRFSRALKICAYWRVNFRDFPIITSAWPHKIDGESFRVSFFEIFFWISTNCFTLLGALQKIYLRGERHKFASIRRNRHNPCVCRN